MEELAAVADRPLYWIQPKALERCFELRSDDKLVASLVWETSCGSLARARASVGSWTCKRVGFLNPRVTVRESGSEVNLATFWPRWLGDGSLELAYGRSFRWQSTNFWGTDWMFADFDGTPLVRFLQGSRERKLSNLLKTEAVVDIQPRARDLPELALLVLLGWYLAILRRDDTGAGAAAASAVVS